MILSIVEMQTDFKLFEGGTGNSARSFQHLIQQFTAFMSTERRMQMGNPYSDLADILEVACPDLQVDRKSVV